MNIINKSIPPVIVLGCHKLALGIIRSLGQQGIPLIGAYYNENDMGYVSRYISFKYRCPDPDRDEDGFVNFVVNLAKKYTDALIMPSDDPTLMAVSKHKHAIEKYCRISCSEWNITEKLLLKKHTYRIAEELGIPAPKTLVTTDSEEALAFINTIGYPFILKPSIGHKFFNAFRTKMIIIEDQASFMEKQHIADKFEIEMMLQELIPGDDTHGVNYNSYFMSRDQYVEFTAQKQRLSPRRIGFPCILVSKAVPEILENGRELLRSIEYQGFSCMEFKKDARCGTYKLMEVNARQNLSTALAVTCGINFPYITYRYELFGEVPKTNGYRKGVYWIDIERDFMEYLKNGGFREIGLRDYIWPYVNPHVFCVWSLKDPKPAMKRLKDAARILF